MDGAEFSDPNESEDNPVDPGENGDGFGDPAESDPYTYTISTINSITDTGIPDFGGDSIASPNIPNFASTLGSTNPPPPTDSVAPPTNSSPVATQTFDNFLNSLWGTASNWASSFSSAVSSAGDYIAGMFAGSSASSPAATQPSSSSSAPSMDSFLQWLNNHPAPPPSSLATPPITLESIFPGLLNDSIPASASTPAQQSISLESIFPGLLNDSTAASAGHPGASRPTRSSMTS